MDWKWKLGCAGAVLAMAASAPVVIGQQRAIRTVSNISAQDKASGAKQHPELMKEFGGAYVGPQAKYVEGVGRRIAVQSGLSNAQGDFTVTLLNSPVNNAFAIPGGYVYVTRQLMALMNDEAELAGVLGHEVGHVAAQHGQRRQQAAQRNAVGGALLGALAGALLGDSGFSGLIQKGIGTGSQLLTLKFSRTQEYEADDLGIRYLASGGYDPRALSDMLASLAAQSDLDAQVTGNARSTPAWASTHPDPGARVERAAKAAEATRATSTVRNRDAFLNAVDGVLYGDDPKQGVIDGNRFRHPDLRLSFTIPSGFGMENGANAVSITGSGGQAQFSAAPYSGNLDAYINSVFAKLGDGKGGVPAGEISRTTINGLPVAYRTVRASTQSSQVDATVFAYDFGGGKAYHFLLLTQAGQGIGPFSAMLQSVQRLSAQEAAAIKPRRVDVVTVKAGDTVQSLAKRMAYTDYQLDRFLTINALEENSALRAGQRVKIVTW
ncbi:M48 family metalloprotease [Sphingobium limneticum]|uniref:M48 family metalloprotease n=1 Tax=Sphingobium limneticum TaxID=1007511 RepID=A0A5J5I149_9SPHN|nr:M48 family metalloprotease [Sphingobium limneticum]KAA9015892.1 M48 family metalloprotease [Sphingobium limneticum]KAA9028305.1 M48 family metalloprotease [Sphingobium limneticum]